MKAAPRVDSDQAFRAALAGLNLEQQRAVGKRFVDHVMELTESSKVRKAMAVVNADESLDEEDIADGYRSAKTAAIESYTLCGNQGDWRDQAGHFVAAAAAACLAPRPQADRDSGVAWNVAMNARMARVCEKVAAGEGGDDSEAREQYRILESFLRTDSRRQ